LNFIDTSTICSWDPFEKTKKPTIISNPAHEKRMDDPMSLFVRHGFSHEKNNKPYLNFYMKKGELFIYRMIPKVFGSSG
jgi:hypothetical protein